MRALILVACLQKPEHFSVYVWMFKNFVCEKTIESPFMFFFWSKIYIHFRSSKRFTDTECRANGRLRFTAVEILGEDFFIVSGWVGRLVVLVEA